MKFCSKNEINLLADEVYQENVYINKFVSFKKIASTFMESLKTKSLGFGLFSFHSVSKGLFGECGKRGGYLECFNVGDNFLEIIYKLFSITLCPNVIGQLAVF